MTSQTFAALILLAVATLYTPGPNNAMLASSGARFGFMRTLPHMLGVAVGFPVMLLIVGLLLGEIFRQSALLRETLRWGGALLLLWLAWKIASSTGAVSGNAAERPMSFRAAAAFQWINPKAWSMAIAATSQFIQPTDPVRTSLIVGLVFLILGVGSASAWVAAGRTIARWLTTHHRQRIFNITMAALIVLSVAELVRT